MYLTRVINLFFKHSCISFFVVAIATLHSFPLSATPLFLTLKKSLFAPYFKKASHRFKIINSTNGPISISYDKGTTWKPLGNVLSPSSQPIQTTSHMDFSAANWAPTSSIAATSVNALHVKVSQWKGHAILFSILPKSQAKSFPIDVMAAIKTTIMGGETLFGSLAPLVGDNVYLKSRYDDVLQPWPTSHIPQVDDEIVIICKQYRFKPYSIEIDNKFGGFVYWSEPSTKTAIGLVYRPVLGTGRFDGTFYQTNTSVRANHPGVLCISTSPKGEIGGFQIIPSNHANDPTLSFVSNNHAYMVIGPFDKVGLEGLFPIFKGVFRPGSKVLGKINGKWLPLPSITGINKRGLAHIEAFRIFP